MKRIYLASTFFAVVLIVSFQNCSKTNFDSSSETSEATSLDKSVQTIDSGTRVQTAQGVDAPIECPMIMCAAPPENCHYEQDATTDLSNTGDRSQRFCAGGCGRLVCDKPHIKICETILCAAPPVGCHYAEKTAKGDPNGCDTSCGQLVCDRDPIKLPPIDEPPADQIDPVTCPLYKCQAPPEGCHLAGVNKKDENGCNIGCGAVVCSDGDATEINPTNILPIKRVKPLICPMYMCAAPPQTEGQRCEYVSGTQPVDKNGCHIGCGIVTCADVK